VTDTPRYRRRDWVPAELEAAIAAMAEGWTGASPAALQAALDAELAAHDRWVERECISLIAGTNAMNPAAAKYLSHPIGSRPSLGWPGDKYETGLAHAERIEVLTTELLKRVFRCDFAEHRVASGSIANLYAYMATCAPGDAIVAFPARFAGHVTHHPAGAAGLYRLRVLDMPMDAAAMTIDLDALRALARRERPRLVIVGGSMCLYAYPVREVRAIADEVGAAVMYDAAHMSGLIAGGAFQQPLAEGAHLMTASTYKSFGGPPSGMVLTNDAALAARLDAIAHPGLTANFDLGRTAALAAACLDLVEHGAAYARACIEVARALAAALRAQGVPVFAATAGANAGRDTDSQFVAVPAGALPVARSARTPPGRGFGGTAASRLLEPANLLATGIEIPADPVPGDQNAVRLGTQEIVRWGFGPAHMPRLASMLARAWVKGEDPASMRAEVVAWRREFQRMHHVRG
jgi:glycine hydroxymethyltransferase